MYRFDHICPIAFLLTLWLFFGIDAAYVKSNVFPDGCGSNTGITDFVYDDLCRLTYPTCRKPTNPVLRN
jgi:hypothetical protein